MSSGATTTTTAWPDLFVANDAHPNLLFHNERNGTFREVAFDAGVAFDEDGRERAGMGIDFGDYDNDGRLDLAITNFYGEPHSLYRNQRDGAFVETTWPSGVGEATLPVSRAGAPRSRTSTTTAGKDLFFVNGHVYPEVDRHGLDETYAQRSLVLRNQGDGAFRSLGGAAGEALDRRRVGRGAAFGDYDDDGRVDVAITTVNDRHAAPQPIAGRRRRLARGRISWAADQPRRDRRADHGAGRRPAADAGGPRRRRATSRKATCARTSAWARRDTVAELEVRWPSGAVDRMRDVRGRQVVTVEEGKGVVSKRGARPRRDPVSTGAAALPSSRRCWRPFLRWRPAGRRRCAIAARGRARAAP